MLNEMPGMGSEREAAQSEQRQRISELGFTVLKQRVAKTSRRWSVTLTIYNVELKPANSDLQESRKQNMTLE